MERKINFELLNEKKPDEPKFSVNYMDRTMDPLVNFNEYSNGNWIKQNPIPEDKIEWSASMELVERNRYILCKIAEDCAINYINGKDVDRKITGRFYTSAMNTELIEKLGFKPVEDLFKKVDTAKSKNDIINVASELESYGIPGFFSIFSSTDEKNSSIYSLYIYQGGISLPNRDYYFDEKFEDIKNKFREHIKNMFILYGCGEELSKKYADTVIKIETDLAGYSRKPEELRDPERNYNRLDINKIFDSYSSLNFMEYFSGIKLPEINYAIIGQPEFLDGLKNLITEADIDDLKIFLKWNILDSAAPYLHKEVEDEDFNFYHRILLGQKEPEKRWKKAISIIDSHIGEALGKLYVEKEFGPESKERMDTMVKDLMEVFTERLKNLDWMSSKTKEKAIEKFSKFRPKIGYPSKFIDYSNLEIKEDDFFGNILRSNTFEFRRDIDRINKPVDKELWEMTPPTVNAYFSPTENEIVFPAGILQPPFFDPALDDAVNYGATGATIAHEITHGFDDEGRKYDADGNINEWWTEEDEKLFNEKAEKVVSIYNNIEVLPGLHINGKLTLGENIADIGGISIAYEALQRRLKRNPEMDKRIDGLTPEQRFYAGWAQSWRSAIREEALKWQISSDPHSPESVRAEIPVYVHKEFEKNFEEFSKKKKTEITKIEIW